MRSSVVCNVRRGSQSPDQPMKDWTASFRSADCEDFVASLRGGGGDVVSIKATPTILERVVQCAFRGDREIESNYLQLSVEDCEINIIKRFSLKRTFNLSLSVWLIVSCAAYPLCLLCSNIVDTVAVDCLYKLYPMPSIMFPLYRCNLLRQYWCMPTSRFCQRYSILTTWPCYIYRGIWLW